MIDWTKPIMNGSGEAVELIYTFGKQTRTKYPRVCLIGKGTVDERINTFTEEGCGSAEVEDDKYDLVNVPEAKKETKEVSLQKDAKQVSPYVQALIEGKTVQYLINGRYYDVELIGSLLAGAGVNSTLRIKPEPKYRPYTKEEWEPVIKVKSKSSGTVFTIQEVLHSGVRTTNGVFGFCEMLQKFTHLDGKALGELE